MSAVPPSHLFHASPSTTMVMHSFQPFFSKSINGLALYAASASGLLPEYRYTLQRGYRLSARQKEAMAASVCVGAGWQDSKGQNILRRIESGKACVVIADFRDTPTIPDSKQPVIGHAFCCVITQKSGQYFLWIGEENYFAGHYTPGISAYRFKDKPTLSNIRALFDQRQSFWKGSTTFDSSTEFAIATNTEKLRKGHLQTSPQKEGTCAKKSLDLAWMALLLSDASTIVDGTLTLPSKSEFDLIRKPIKTEFEQHLIVLFFDFWNTHQTGQNPFLTKVTNEALVNMVARLLYNLIKKPEKCGTHLSTLLDSIRRYRKTISHFLTAPTEAPTAVESIPPSYNELMQIAAQMIQKLPSDEFLYLIQKLASAFSAKEFALETEYTWRPIIDLVIQNSGEILTSLLARRETTQSEEYSTRSEHYRLSGYEAFNHSQTRNYKALQNDQLIFRAAKVIVEDCLALLADSHASRSATLKLITYACANTDHNQMLEARPGYRVIPEFNGKTVNFILTDDPNLILEASRQWHYLYNLKLPSLTPSQYLMWEENLQKNTFKRDEWVRLQLTEYCKKDCLKYLRHLWSSIRTHKRNAKRLSLVNLTIQTVMADETSITEAIHLTRKTLLTVFGKETRPYWVREGYGAELTKQLWLDKHPSVFLCTNNPFSDALLEGDFHRKPWLHEKAKELGLRKVTDQSLKDAWGGENVFELSPDKSWRIHEGRVIEETSEHPRSVDYPSMTKFIERELDYSDLAHFRGAGVRSVAPRRTSIVFSEAAPLPCAGAGSAAYAETGISAHGPR